jgi:hypothetical protein
MIPGLYLGEIRGALIAGRVEKRRCTPGGQLTGCGVRGPVGNLDNIA